MATLTKPRYRRTRERKVIDPNEERVAREAREKEANDAAFERRACGLGERPTGLVSRLEGDEKRELLLDAIEADDVDFYARNES